MLECERDAVADAARMGDLDRLADMEGEVGWRNVAEPELARVQRDRHVARQESDDLHVASVVARAIRLSSDCTRLSATTCGSARISAAATAVCRNTSSGEVLRRICAM